MKIHPLTAAVVTATTRMQQSGHSDLKSQGWAESNELVKSLNQANGMTSLHGLVVHGAACASLLALGSMAAIGRESGYELIMARASNVVPKASLSGYESVAGTVAKPNYPENVPEVLAEQKPAVGGFVGQPAVLELPDETDEILTVEHTFINSATSNPGALMLLEEAEQWSSSAENPIASALATSFSFELLNQMHEGRILRDNRPHFAGKAQPGSLIELLDQHGDVVGSSWVDSNGMWHITPMMPLANGEYDFSLYATYANGVRELVAPPIHLVIAVEGPVLQSVIEASESPSLSLMPLIDSEAELNLTLILPVEPEPVQHNFAFGFGELLPMSEPELLISEPVTDEFVNLDESALQQLLHPEGGITLWEQQEDLALLALDYSPSAAIGSSDPLFADLITNNDD